MSATPPPPSDPPVRKPIDARLVQWFAAELILDSRARLVEGGAGGDTRIDLAQVFVDLPVAAWCGREAVAEHRLLVRSICREPVAADETVRRLARRRTVDAVPRALIVGGPGSGKSTATTMISQLLRLEQVRANLHEVAAPLREQVREVVSGLDGLRGRSHIAARRDLLPLRISLPELSRWMASRDGEQPAQLLWRFLADQATEHAAICGLALEFPPSDLASRVLAHDRILWIFDGLDEVPRSSGRERVMAAIHVITSAGGGHGVLVTTRPQGYDGELGDLDSLVLTEMSPKLALEYGRRLLGAWNGITDPRLNERLQSLEEEFAKPEVQALMRSPLHATMATLLVADQGTLPNARYLLFEHYFDTIFKRELGKKGDHGVRLEDRQLLRMLHARVGLVLHARSQERAGARPRLSPRELRAILEAILREEGRGAEDVQSSTERTLRFAADRLVLLLRIADGGYAFGIRSLQEFFAGIALLDGDTDEVVRRLDAVALNPHWTNVLGLIVSGLAVPGAGRKTRENALEYTYGLCRTLNDRARGGRIAAACLVGSRLSIAMLRETERYGGPWIHEPLWEIALEAASSPLQMRSARQTRISSSENETVSAQWDDELEVHVRLGSLAAGWQGARRGHWLQRVLESSEALLGANKEYPGVGWYLLFPALQRNEAQALRIADEHAPGTAELAKRLLAIACDRRVSGINAWVATFADGHASWFSPGWLMQHLPLPRHEAEGGSDTWVDHGILSVRQLHWSSNISMQFDVQIERGIECALWSIEAAADSWSQMSLPNVAASTAWSAWHKIAAFHRQPSRSSLADALDAITEPGVLDDVRRGRPVMAWPISTCVEFAADAAELRAVATAVRGGRLGDLEDWKAAEARWAANPVASDDELVTWLTAHELPWTEGIAKEGRVFSFFISREHDSDLSSQISRICKLLQGNTRYPRRLVHSLRVILVSCARSSDVRSDLVPLDVVKYAPALPDTSPYDVLFNINLLLPDLSSPLSEQWYELFHERGTRGWNRGLIISGTEEWYRERLGVILRSLVARLSARPDQWGLADAVWSLLHVLPDAPLAGLHQPSLPSDASDRARASAAALLLVAPPMPTAGVPDLLACLVSPHGSFDLREELAKILARRDDHEHATAVLLHMLDATTDADQNLQDVILAGLFRHLKQSASPAFSTALAWKEHHLPEPYLFGQAPDVLSPRILKLIELSNIRLFKETPDIDAPFPAPKPDHGQWIVLVGENGVGKTTLLRALGLALADPTVATRLLDENHPFVRNGGDGRIAVELDTGPVKVIVRRDARTEAVVPAGNEKVVRPWVIGYGVRRGNARGEKDRAPEWGPTGELHTLFDRPATLVNAVDWLLDLDRRVLNERRQYGPEPEDGGPRLNAATWQSVERALKALLGVTAIEPEERHVMVTHPEFGRVQLDALSDGYLTTTGWVIDLIARWVQRQEDLREAIGRDLLRQMTGIVLIDEIDLHLHPIWQMHIIDDVRRLFPRLSFVVTTHNPLTLQGARPGEIFIMRRGHGGRIELTQRDIQPGHDVDRVLFEQFGISYTFDHETRAMLERHRELLERGVAPDDAERVGLESQIAARLGRVGKVLADERGGEHDPSRPWSDAERHLLDQHTRGKG